MTILRLFSLLFITQLAISFASAQDKSKPRFKAVAFDYFVLFDPNSVIPVVEEVYPGKGLEFTKAWRSKQFEYGFLRSIVNRHEDFFKVTEDALVYTAQLLKLELNEQQRNKLLNAYLNLKPWPDTEAALKKLKKAGVKIITIANFSHKMLKSNADNAGLTPYFTELLSTEVNKTYKPDAKAYALGMKRLKLKKNEIIFAAFGGWDAFGSKSFGYTTYWVNRFSFPAENLGLNPDHTSTSINGLVEIILGEEVE